MKAVVFANGKSAVDAGGDESRPSELEWLLDRPFVEHVVEYLVDVGIQEVHFVLSIRPEQFEHLLDDGKRWGCRFHYHLAQDPDQVGDLMRLVPVAADEPVLVVQGNRLLFRGECTKPRPEEKLPRVFVYSRPDEGAAPRWTGWAWARGADLRAIAPTSSVEDAGRNLWQLAIAQGEVSIVRDPLDTGSRVDLHRSIQRILDREYEGLYLLGHQASPGIWLERAVELHPSTVLTPPLYLGENAHIAAGVCLGPGTVIGRNCYVDGGVSVVKSVVLPGSYVGQDLEIEQCIVDRDLLMNLDLGTTVSVPDDFVLGNLDHEPVQRRLVGLATRVLAFGLLIASTPLLLALHLWARFTRSLIPVRRAFVSLPISRRSRRWQTSHLKEYCPGDASALASASLRHFFCRFLPGLASVVRGELDLVGLPPRSESEIRDLPGDWRSLYTQSRPGLISESLVTHGARAAADEAFAADAYYASATGLRHDLGLLFRYAGQVLGCLARPDVFRSHALSATDALGHTSRS